MTDTNKYDEYWAEAQAHFDFCSYYEWVDDMKHMGLPETTTVDEYAEYLRNADIDTE